MPDITECRNKISNFLGHPVMTVDRESAVKEYGGE